MTIVSRPGFIRFGPFRKNPSAPFFGVSVPRFGAACIAAIPVRRFFPLVAHRRRFQFDFVVLLGIYVIPFESFSQFARFCGREVCDLPLLASSLFLVLNPRAHVLWNTCLDEMHSLLDNTDDFEPVHLLILVGVGKNVDYSSFARSQLSQ